jgi:pimeloyl-ACP methyl ester carboxylesterase
MFAIAHGGSAPPVVLIHGFCQSSTYWAPTADLLAQRGVAAFAPDLPGFAASAKEAGPYTMAGLADALLHQLDRWKAEKVVLGGGSMGGVVAQHLALRHPERIERLLLVATGGVTANEALALEKVAVLEAGEWNEAAVTPIVDGFFYQRPAADKLAAYRQIALAASPRAAVEAARSNALNRTLDRLGEIRVPTLIIQGRHDRARTPEHGAEMRERISGSRLVVIEDAGHTPQLEQPAAFHAAALPFLLASE